METLRIIITVSLLILHWIPRILCILFAVFISLFAFDVFGQGSGFWKTLIDLLLHLVPTFLVIIIIILSWKWSWIGGVSFILLGIVYLIWSSQTGRGSHIIDITLFSVGILFLIDWFLRKRIKAAQEEYREQ
ncbi:MAG: hypothetical protein AB9846_15315 [Tenuifilaceae bacterium]